MDPLVLSGVIGTTCMLTPTRPKSQISLVALDPYWLGFTTERSYSRRVQSDRQNYRQTAGGTDPLFLSGSIDTMCILTATRPKFQISLVASDLFGLCEGV